MGIAVQTLLSLIVGLLPEFGVISSSVVAKVLTALETFLPNLIQNAPALLAPVLNIITLLKTSGDLTADQVTALDTYEQQTYDAFNAQATKDGFPDPAAAPPAGDASGATS